MGALASKTAGRRPGLARQAPQSPPVFAKRDRLLMFGNGGWWGRLWKSGKTGLNGIFLRVTRSQTPPCGQEVAPGRVAWGVGKVEEQDVLQAGFHPSAWIVLVPTDRIMAITKHQSVNEFLGYVGNVQPIIDTSAPTGMAMAPLASLTP